MKIISFGVLFICTVLFSCGQTFEPASKILSLTDSTYQGQKYYFGFGAVMQWDPQMMHNEVKYDVLHTHNIFTKKIGGEYTGFTDIGTHVNSSRVRNHWNSLQTKMKSEDMYVQYSSSHGYQNGLAIGVTYNEIRDQVLSMKASEKIIFTMACYSGGLINSFNSKKSEWENYLNNGKNLLVFSSSQSYETSSTGPGVDSDEPAQTEGSAGSAFGHALWKALIGFADGYTSGVHDGLLSLDEIIKFTTAKTLQIGGHTPVYTGSFNKNLIMNRVPKKAEILELLEESKLVP